MSQVVHFLACTEAPRLCEQDITSEKADELLQYLVISTEHKEYIIGSRLCRKCCARLGMTSGELRIALRLRDL